MQKSVLATLLCLTILHLEVTKGQKSFRDIADVSCPAGWKKYQLNCYQLFQTNRTFANAQTDCQTNKASLAAVPDSGVNDFLQSLIVDQSNSYGVILGANQTKVLPFGGDNPNWTWVDGSPWGYTNWGGGEPNNQHNENCAEMVSSTYFIYTGQWNNFPCDNKKNYICSKPAGNCFYNILKYIGN
eukprot:GFUD01058063.1.p1 GENE.GFUD01058063.1~~GFUD01058063.1.p1  ORF type:complete len:185 (-),score=26.67 GFUD01058063.1:979-1533(-)